MTTSTPKKQSASAELAKMNETREKAHRKVRSIRDKRDAHESGTAQMRADLTALQYTSPDEFAGATFKPVPGTSAAKLNAAIRERLQAPNPFADDYGTALADFHRIDEEVQRFKRSRLQELIDEYEGEFHAADAAIRTGWESLLEGTDLYRALLDKVWALIVDTPGIDGQALTCDPRPNEWQRMAREVLDSELARPGINQLAEWKLAQNG